MSTRPTLVFVHGAFADSSGWSSTLADLDGRGFPVLAVPNQLRGLTADADQVRSVLATIEGPVVLVGHSYGGAVIGEAARGADNVRALVFVAAYALDEGESIATVLDPETYPGGLLGPDTTVVRPFGEQDGDLYITEDDFATVFAADVGAARSRLMYLTQRPLSLSAFGGTAAADPAWRSLPCWALVAEEDNAIPPAGQRWMAERAGATISSTTSSHAVMVSRPEAVTATVLAAAESVG
ncbi:alpha/beta fold hydrolase [Nocardioides mangrovi]|uniref:Alpha/beta hydrolase n=1 Tax=Nocardioides mangrovi TaxID=2874580 RepID=A0ABS7U9Y7_9ACTN|nr:alpha/beta hydrolase [Nocardioides mangrovi]MBZ5737472.1 alpha/beta hydrolase [Nocardioides mangrovi]